MLRLQQILIVVLTVCTLASCEFIGNAFKYKETSKAFVEAVLKEDYDKCVDYMAMDHELAKNTNMDTMRKGLQIFRQQLVSNFGTQLDYSFMNAEKKFSTEPSKNMPPNTTFVSIQFSNQKDFGILKVLFDDTSKKILNINILDVKQSIPSMTLFWLCGLLAICVPVFNIYVIRKIKRSDRKRKWLKYIAVIALNTPALTYTAIGVFSFKLINFQLMLGISFAYMGYLNSYWTIGIPLGGLYWFIRLKQKPTSFEETAVASYAETAPAPKRFEQP